VIEAVILSQGNELTTGQIIDTNSAWISDKLWSLGIAVRRIVIAPDREKDLVEIIKHAASIADVVISTGGLGPTRDDLTAQSAASAFQRPIEENSTALAMVQQRYAEKNYAIKPIDKKQAQLPRGCRVLNNANGTAPGFVIEEADCALYFLPGVPAEMKWMISNEVIPDIQQKHTLNTPFTHEICTSLPESLLEQRLADLTDPGLEIGFRAHISGNKVKIRFSTDFSAEARHAALMEITQRLGRGMLGMDVGSIDEIVAHKLVQRKETVALAESCTAGQLCARLGAVPGASGYLLEGVVAYSNTAKIRQCGVSLDLLTEHGAVSEAVARQMAEGIQKRSSSDWGIGISGIAGPGGGSKEKPVGTIHIAISNGKETTHRALLLHGSRRQITGLSTTAALVLLLRRLQNEKEGPGKDHPYRVS